MLIAALIFYESRISEPMIPVRLYRNRLIAGGNWVGAANGAITMAVVGFLPVYMQGLMGSSTLMSGVALGAMSVLWPFGGFVGSRLVLRMPYRLSSTIGGVILVTGSTLLILLHPGANPLQPIIAAGHHGPGHGHYQRFLRGRDPGQCRLVSARRGDVERVLLPHDRAIVRQRRVRRHIQRRTGRLEVRSTATSSSTCSRKGTQQIANIPGIAGVLDALAHSVHNIYLLSGLIAVLVFAGAFMFPAKLRLIKER